MVSGARIAFRGEPWLDLNAMQGREQAGGQRYELRPEGGTASHACDFSSSSSKHCAVPSSADTRLQGIFYQTHAPMRCESAPASATSPTAPAAMCAPQPPSLPPASPAIPARDCSTLWAVGLPIPPAPKDSSSLNSPFLGRFARRIAPGVHGASSSIHR